MLMDALGFPSFRFTFVSTWRTHAYRPALIIRIVVTWLYFYRHCSNRDDVRLDR
ncbi:hypothetical protein KCP73_06260 [Salmonella enterica subsp. enterica]|nr:hypothetical protein KCP73_06260 [Salmonella enterica subsp. enterica]